MYYTITNILSSLARFIFFMLSLFPKKLKQIIQYRWADGPKGRYTGDQTLPWGTLMTFSTRENRLILKLTTNIFYRPPCCFSLDLPSRIKPYNLLSVLSKASIKFNNKNISYVRIESRVRGNMRKDCH